MVALVCQSRSTSLLLRPCYSFLQTAHFVKSRAHSPRPTRKIIATMALRRAILMKADPVVSLHAHRLFSGRAAHAKRLLFAKRTVRSFSVSRQSRSLFSASFQTCCLTALAYLNAQKYGLFCSLLSKEITSISFPDLWRRDKNFRILQECDHRVKCHVTGHGIKA